MTTNKVSTASKLLPLEMRPLPILGQPAHADIAREILDDMAELQVSPRSLEDRTSPFSSPKPSRTAKGASKWFDSEDDSTPETTPQKTPTAPQKSKLWGNYNYGDSSTESSPSKSGPNTPKNAGTPTDIATPSPLKDAKEVIRESDTSCNILRGDQQVLDRGLQCLIDLESPQRTIQVTSMQRLFVDALNRSVSPAQEIPRPSARRNLSLAISNSGEVAGWVKSALGRTELVLLDRDHHIKFQNGSGKHILTENDVLSDKIIKRFTHRTTGIWCGCITTASDPVGKFSSFIPRIMPEMGYYSLVTDAILDKTKTIARAENKGLYLIKNGQHDICIQVYFSSEGREIRSAFPIFHYEVYNGNNSHLSIPMDCQDNATAPCISISFERPYAYLLSKVKGLKTGDEAIQYETEEMRIVDIALLIGEQDEFGPCPFERGIFVSFPKKLL